MHDPTTTDANTASYVERCGLILELQEILANKAFEWIDQARTSSGNTAHELINDLINRQPPATIAELWSMLERVIAYHQRLEKL